MKLFTQIVRTAVNVGTLPVALARDVLTLGGSIDNDGRPHTADHLEKIKREAADEHR